MKESDGGENVLYLVCISISTPIVIWYYSLARCCYRKNWAKGTWDLSIISYNHMGIYSFLKIKGLMVTF